jgi:hypothetical protein
MQFFLYCIYLFFSSSYTVSISYQGENAFYYKKIDSFKYMLISLIILSIFFIFSFTLPFLNRNYYCIVYLKKIYARFLGICTFCIVFAISEAMDTIYEVGGIFSEGSRIIQSLFVFSESVKYYFYLQILPAFFFLLRDAVLILGKNQSEGLPHGHALFLKFTQKADYFYLIVIAFLFAPVLWWIAVPIESGADRGSSNMPQCAGTQEECDASGRIFVAVSLCFFAVHIMFLRWQTLRIHAALHLLRAGQDIANPRTWSTQLLPKKELF